MNDMIEQWLKKKKKKPCQSHREMIHMHNMKLGDSWETFQDFTKEKQLL